AINKLTTDKKFRGRNVIAAIPSGEMFIDHIRMPTPFCGATSNESQNDNPMSKKKNRLPSAGKWGRGTNDKLQEAVFSKIKQKLPLSKEFNKFTMENWNSQNRRVLQIYYLLKVRILKMDHQTFDYIFQTFIHLTSNTSNNVCHQNHISF
ncbi:hypothetical protein LCGC14_2778970, partial [marine sediment metagenome]